MARTQPQVPQLSLNGTALTSHSYSTKQPLTSPASANPTNPTARPPKSPAVQTPITEIDSAWGANFWVTLIEPQVRFAGRLVMTDRRELMGELGRRTESGAVLCMSGDGSSELGPSRREFRVRPYPLFRFYASSHHVSPPSH